MAILFLHLAGVEFVPVYREINFRLLNFHAKCIIDKIVCLIHSVSVRAIPCVVFRNRREEKDVTISEDEEVEAVVSDIQGPKSSRFAVTYPIDDTLLPKKGATITFSLSRWRGDGLPGPGQKVILTGVVEFAKGWRAGSARPVRLRSKKEGVQK